MNSDPFIGQTINNYEILHRLGKGGMSTVYRARQVNMARDVAIKIMSADLAEDPRFVARFEQEARVIANLQHPRILPVHDFGHQGELFYLVMRVIDGESLYHRMLKGPLPVMTAAKFVNQIAEALDYAHAQGIIHRDLKPNNVLLDEWDNCYLMDFGLAKLVAATQNLTQSGAVLGTPAYMAPEQWRGESVDARTDVYALGVILYEMVLGQPPFESDTPFTLMYKHLNDPPPRPSTLIPDLPDAIEEVILKALAKNREDRFQSAGELAQAFASVARVAGSLTVRERRDEAQENPSGEQPGAAPDSAGAAISTEPPQAAGEVAGPPGPVGEVAANDSAADVPFPSVEALMPPPVSIAPPPPPIPVSGVPARSTPPRVTPTPPPSSRWQRALEAVDHSLEAAAEKALTALPPAGMLETGEPPASAAPLNAPAFQQVRALIPDADPLVGVLDVRGTAQWQTWKTMFIAGIAMFFLGGIINAGFFSFMGLLLLAYLGVMGYRVYRGSTGRYYLGFTPQRVIVLPRDASGWPQQHSAWVVPWNMVQRLRLTDRYMLLDITAQDSTLSFGGLVAPEGDGDLGQQTHWLPGSPIAQLVADQGFETRNL